MWRKWKMNVLFFLCLKFILDCFLLDFSRYSLDPWIRCVRGSMKSVNDQRRVKWSRTVHILPVHRSRKRVSHLYQFSNTTEKMFINPNVWRLLVIFVIPHGKNLFIRVKFIRNSVIFPCIPRIPHCFHMNFEYCIQINDEWCIMSYRVQFLAFGIHF